MYNKGIVNIVIILAGIFIAAVLIGVFTYSPVYKDKPSYQNNYYQNN